MKGGLGRKSRRNTAIRLLNEQLERGTKPEKVDGKTTENMIPLTEFDKKRINKELATLKK